MIFYYNVIIFILKSGASNNTTFEMRFKIQYFYIIDFIILYNYFFNLNIYLEMYLMVQLFHNTILDILNIQHFLRYRFVLLFQQIQLQHENLDV